MWRDMKTKKNKEKDFDCVKMMRDIRDQVSREIMGMTYEEQRAWMDKRLAKKPTKKAA